jgi:hypothetical protein
MAGFIFESGNDLRIGERGGVHGDLLLGYKPASLMRVLQPPLNRREPIQGVFPILLS